MTHYSSMSHHSSQAISAEENKHVTKHLSHPFKFLIPFNMGTMCTSFYIHCQLLQGAFSIQYPLSDFLIQHYFKCAQSKCLLFTYKIHPYNLPVQSCFKRTKHSGRQLQYFVYKTLVTGVSVSGSNRLATLCQCVRLQQASYTLSVCQAPTG